MIIKLLNKYLKTQPFQVKSFLLTWEDENPKKFITNKINFQAPWSEWFGFWSVLSIKQNIFLHL